jgi:hypothetical protein
MLLGPSEKCGKYQFGEAEVKKTWDLPKKYDGHHGNTLIQTCEVRRVCFTGDEHPQLPAILTL